MKVHELLASESSWTQGRMARNALGDQVNCNSPDACAWCLLGAVYRCYGFNISALIVIRQIMNKLGVSRLTIWNDTHTHAEVIAVVKELDV